MSGQLERTSDADDWREQLAELKWLLESEGEVEPADLVDDWVGWRPPLQFEYGASEKRMVEVEQIRGTDPMNVDRLDERRLMNIVKKILEGDWVPAYNRVVLAQHPDGEYFVSADGNHRVLVYTFFDIKEIYAKVIPYARPDDS